MTKCRLKNSNDFNEKIQYKSRRCAVCLKAGSDRRRRFLSSDSDRMRSLHEFRVQYLLKNSLKNIPIKFLKWKYSFGYLNKTRSDGKQNFKLLSETKANLIFPHLVIYFHSITWNLATAVKIYTCQKMAKCNFWKIFT